MMILTYVSSLAVLSTKQHFISEVLAYILQKFCASYYCRPLIQLFYCCILFLKLTNLSKFN